MRSGGAVAHQRSLGARVADAGEEERRWRCGAGIARPGIEPATGRECAHEGVETGAGQVPRFWTDAGLRVSGEARRGESEQGDAAAVADRGRVAAGEAAEGGGGARLAPRRSCRGELVQWDTSEHDWLEGRGPKLYTWWR